jgi:PAS domain-containing protein
MRAIERASASRMADIFRQVPAAIAILRGPDHVYELANDGYQALIGPRQLIGRPIRSAIPELAGQGIYELLDAVRAGGKPYVGRSLRSDMVRDGAMPRWRMPPRTSSWRCSATNCAIRCRRS